MFFRNLILLLVLTNIELTIVSLPLTFIVLFLWQQVYSESEALSLAFTVGFVYDLILVRPLGTTSLLFMTILFIASLYKRKYQGDNLIFVGIMAFFSFLALEFIYGDVLAFVPSIGTTFITVVLAHVFAPQKKYEPNFQTV